MQLKSLEIQGFKSFPDKTRLEFGQGITAVVGPNGSGKSNIVDAVRWVFGEQSSKTLRGSKMEDVIFLGTQTRKAQGMASVTLVIDNQDRTMPIDSDEISVARRLYRSGESEYRLNGTAVRLKDVHELFMDTGLGRDGYSIIGQGKIDEIVSNKSKERREIFDEAAGISRYRYRKGEAERQLSQAEENLLRLKDILLELEGRVEPLRVESEKANQFIRLAQEKKVLEISVWMAELDRYRTQLRELEDRYLLASVQNQEIEEENTALEDSITRIYEQMQQAAASIDRLRTEIKGLEEIQAQGQADRAVCRNDIQHNDQSITRLESEREGFAGSSAQLDVQMEELNQRVLAYQSTLQDGSGRTEELRAQLAQENAQSAQYATQGEQHRVRRTALYQQIGEAQRSTSSALALLGATTTNLEQLRAGSTTKADNLQAVKRELATCTDLLAQVDEKLLGYANARSGYELKLQSRQSKLEQLQAQQNALLDKAREHSQRIHVLQDMERSMEGYAGSVKYLLRQAKDGALRGVCGTVSQLINTGAEHTIAIETALGGAMQNIVVENEQAAKTAIRTLSESRQGRATFLPLTSVKGNELNLRDLDRWEGYVGLASQLVTYDSRYAGVVHWLLGRIVIAEDLDSAVAMAKGTGYRFRIVTLDGQVVNTGGSMTGGSAARSGSILGRRQEIERLEQEVARLEGESAQLQQQVDAASQEREKINAELWGIESESRTAVEDKIRAEGERKRLDIALAEAERAFLSAGEEEARLARQLEELQGQNLSSGQLVEELSTRLAEAEEEIARLDLLRSACVQQAAQLQQQLSEEEFNRLSTRKDLETVESQRNQLTLQLENEQLRRQKLEEELAALREKNGEILLRIQELDAQEAQLAQQVAQHQQVILEHNNHRTQWEQETTQLRAKSKEVLSRREGVARDLARLEERKHTSQGEYDKLIARLWDEYEMTRSQAEQTAEKLEDMRKAQQRLQELRSRIKALGHVNVGSIEEYQEVSQRYIFLKEQLEDVEHSKGELTRLIGELTGQMQEIFLENFHKISQSFSRIFTELFGGGKAKLALTDENDVLECGIDILVQPPGKMVPNLAALSGGERAFVAIAIFFAILQVNPAPFCLLDEIEAALDDVNVTKFAQYLHRFTDTTQFIAITHRRGTMEEADILYGVTMQEDGVSKLLELKVSEVEQKLGMK